MTAKDLTATLPAPPASRPRRRIAVASGKGGVGKTWLAITLAQAFAEQGERVLLFDGDLGLANVDIQLGLTPECDLSWVLSGRMSLEEAICRVDPGAFDVLPGRSGSGAFASLAAPRLDSLLAALDDLDYSVVLLDLGAGLEAHSRRMAAHADVLLTVATEEPTSLTDAYAVLKLFMMDKPAGDARLVVNQASSQAAGRRTFETLAQACRQFLKFDVPLAGIVRRDDHVRETIRRQTPLLTRHPGCHAAADVRVIAGTLLK
jgi:flagellar biosynthesis protein FlhG